MTQTQYRRPNDFELHTLAKSLAAVVHSGQTRKGNGEPYFNHLRRVGEAAYEHSGLRAEIIAYLHDTIEDTTVTKHTLADVGFPTDIVHDVVMLTRNPDEEYLHYIGRLIEYGSDEALVVKLSDLADNLSSLDTLPWDTTELRERYVKATGYVLGEQNRRVDERATHLPQALTAA